MNIEAKTERSNLSLHVEAMMAIAECIRTVKEIPSGHLYAMLLGRMTLEKYQAVIAALKRIKLVEEKGDVLRWIGPEVQP